MSRQIAAALVRSPSCSAARPTKKLAFRFVGVERERALESRLGLGRDDAIGGRRQRLAEIGLPFGIFAVQGDQLATGSDRLGETTKPQIDRRKNFVAARIVGILLEMRFHLRHEACNRFIFMHVA